MGTEPQNGTEVNQDNQRVIVPLQQTIPPVALPPATVTAQHQPSTYQVHPVSRASSVPMVVCSAPLCQTVACAGSPTTYCPAASYQTITHPGLSLTSQLLTYPFQQQATVINALPTPPPSFCPMITWKQSYGMEQVWYSEFHKLFSQFLPQNWQLSMLTHKLEGHWFTFVDSAKVRFCCEGCGHGWTSMKGRVTFWFILNAFNQGFVFFQLYGQQCQRCKGSGSGKFEPAMWYPEEVTKVLINIYHRVGQVYYNFCQAPIQKNRRPGKPRNPHNSDLCQACQDGVCSERK